MVPADLMLILRAQIAAASSASSSPSPAKHKKLVQLSGDPTAPESPLAFMPSGPDDNNTTLSSSSDSNKPASVASGTTFALDEKDSLRPDDSASVKAVEDEELSGSRIGSDDGGVRAFRDQLREISSMEPSRRGVPQQTFANAPKGVLYVPPQGPGIGAVPNANRSPPGGESPSGDCPPDQKLLDALDNPRDRVWVLKLEQDVIDFVKDAKEASLTLPQCHAFYRLLAHKMADYYMLGHLVDDTTSAVRLYKTPNCRIPPPLTGITAPSTAASTPPPPAPKMTILQRGSGPAIANGSNNFSNSENESEDDKKNKAPVSREQREAQYEAARLRIMGSAKPSDSSEAQKEQQESRSSSVAGKKHKKKPRADSDDGFEVSILFRPFGDGQLANIFLRLVLRIVTSTRRLSALTVSRHPSMAIRSIQTLRSTRLAHILTQVRLVNRSCKHRAAPHGDSRSSTLSTLPRPGRRASLVHTT